MMSELLHHIGRPNEAAIALSEAEANDVHLHDRAREALALRDCGPALHPIGSVHHEVLLMTLKNKAALMTLSCR